VRILRISCFETRNQVGKANSLVVVPLKPTELGVELMRKIGILTLALLVFAVFMVGQDETATFRTEARLAFVWGSDTQGGAISSTINDPLTGNASLKLRYGGVEVNSRMGFEKLSTEEVRELIAYTTTIVNNTHEKLSVEYGGITVDGHIVQPLSIVTDSKHFSKKQLSTDGDIVEIGKLYCFTSGYLSSKRFFPAKPPALGMAVDPQTSLTVSSIIRDPRHYPIRCSVEGCLPTGTVRYSIRVDNHDYIFGWQGRSLVNCGR
jgi:hypothetical protein